MYPSDLQPCVRKTQWGTGRFWVLQQFFEKYCYLKSWRTIGQRMRLYLCLITHKNEFKQYSLETFRNTEAICQGPEMRRGDVERPLRKHRSVVAPKAPSCTAPGLWSAVPYYAHKLFYVQISSKISLPQLKVYSPIHSLIHPSSQQLSPKVCSPDICLWFQVNLSWSESWKWPIYL